MKKISILLLSLFMFSGCNIERIKDDKDEILSKVFVEKSKLSNIVASGYKYYIPNGVTLVGRDSYNEVLYSKGNNYYLYVDLVGYYNNTKLDYEVKEEIYYSRKINTKKKEGYIEIEEEDDLYFLQIMYNYGKIEAYVNKEDIERALIESGYILSSIKFNDILIKNKYGVDKQTQKEEKLNIFVPRKKEDFFLNSREQQDDE